LAPVAIAWQFRLNLEGFLWLQAGTAALLGAVTLASFPSGALGRRTRLGWSEFWPESRFFYGAGILRCAATQIDQILVAALFPAQALATYFLARRLYSGAAAFIDAGVDVTLPQLSLQGARDPRRARIAQARVLRMAMIFAAGAGAIVAANAPAAAQWLFGARYADAAGLMPWLALAAVAYGFYSLSVGGESVLGSPRAAMRWVAAAAVIPLLVVPAGAATLGAATLPLAMTAGYGVAGWGAAVTHSLVRPAADFAALAMGATAAVGAASVGFPLTDLSPTVQTAGLNALAAGSFAAALLLPVRKVAL
jgi:O-antigen/teichoic acid export membrane protein